METNFFIFRQAIQAEENCKDTPQWWSLRLTARAKAFHFDLISNRVTVNALEVEVMS